MIEVRKEEDRDFADVFKLNSLAFGTDDEARLVESLRHATTYHSLVAEIDGRIAGHIAFSAVTLNDEPTNFLGLAPMAVLPDFQNQSVGSKLVTEGLKRMQHEGYSAVFVLGHANYYPRFGFETAKLKGFSCEYPSPDESFMVLELVAGSLSGKSGLIKYGPEFAAF